MSANKSLRSSFERSVGLLSAGSYFVVRGQELGEDSIQVESEYVIDPHKKIIINFQIFSGPFLSVRGCLDGKPIKQGDKLIANLKFEDLDFAHRRSIRNFLAANAFV
jgi:hypothetical protein